MSFDISHCLHTSKFKLCIQTQPLQTLLNEILKQESSRSFYLNCITRTCPESMADELRSQASKFPSLLGSQFVNSLAAQPGPISKAIQYLLSAIGIGVYNSGDQADVTWQVMNEFMEQYFPTRYDWRLSNCDEKRTCPCRKKDDIVHTIH